MSKSGNYILGDWGEDIAECFLIKQGYLIVERNFRHHIGEIDLIASKDGYLCFVEVKTRYGYHKGAAEEHVDFRKQGKLRRLASLYLKNRFGTQEMKCRFDVIAIHKNHHGDPQIKLIPHAF